MRRSGRGNLWRALALTASLGLVVTGCGGDDSDEGATDEPPGDEPGEGRQGGTLVFGADQDFAGYNTATTKDNSLAGGQIMRQVWASSYRVRPDFSLEPYLLAEEATVVSEDPFAIEWKIRPDATWSDGVPVTADDFEFVYTMCNGKTEGADCASTSGYELITEFTKVDAKTVRTVFSQTYVDYKGLFGAVPVHIAKERHPESLAEGWNNGFNDDPGVAVGPWKVEKRDRGATLTLVPNESFWGEKPKLARIIFRFLPESLTQPDALRNGEVNMIYPQPQLDQVQLVGELPGVRSEISFGPTFEHLTFNTKNEFLAIKEVRQAIAHGIDRDAIVNRLMKPFSDKASQLDNRLLVSTQKGYEPHGAPYAKVDVKKAQKLLETAGFTAGKGGIYEKDGKPLQLRLSTTAANSLREQQGVLIQAQLKTVGIDIRIDNPPATEFFDDRLPNGNFDIANFAWVGTPFPASAITQLYGSESSSNYGKYANPKVDDAATKAVGIIDETERLAYLNEVDEIMWDDLPNLPLYQKPTFLAFEEQYLNISDNTTTESPFWNSEEWALKAGAN